MDCRSSLTPQQSVQARTEEGSSGRNRDTEARDTLLHQLQFSRQQALLTSNQVDEPQNPCAIPCQAWKETEPDASMVGPQKKCCNCRKTVAGLVNVMQAVEESLAPHPDLRQLCGIAGHAKWIWRKEI